MSLKIKLLTIITVLFFGCTPNVKNWNQYLGPDRNNKITEVSFKHIPEKEPVKLWEVSLGPGYGGVSIFDNEVFILDRKKGESDILRCIDLNTGTEKWNYEYVAKGELPYPGSRAVPTVDNHFVWFVGPHGHFKCINKKTHLPVWEHNLLTDFGGELPNWGFSQSPIVHENLVIVAPQGETAGVVAYNKESGEMVWKSRKLSGTRFHVSPTPASFGGVHQIIIISSCARKDGFSTDEVVAFETKTGKELWKYEGLNSFASIAPAVVAGPNQLFLTECAYQDKYDPISILLEINKNNNQFEVIEKFRNEKAGCKMHPGVVVDDNIYLNSNGRPNQLVCIDFNGELMWEDNKLENFEMGSLIMVGDYLVAQNGKNGEIALIQPSPEKYIELGRYSYFNSDKTQAWAPMAFSNGKLLARDMEKLVCVEL